MASRAGVKKPRPEGGSSSGGSAGGAPAAAATAAYDAVSPRAARGRVRLGGVEGLLELLGRGEAVRRVLGERLQDDRVEGSRDLRVQLARWPGTLGDLLQRHGDRGVALERNPAREGLVQQDADRVDVGGRGDREALRLLGREVLRGAEHRAGLGDLRGAGAGDPEVGHPGAALGVDEHVLGLQVAMNDPVGVRVFGPGEHLADDLHRLAHRQAPLDQVLERRPLDVLHRDVVGAVVRCPGRRRRPRSGAAGRPPRTPRGETARRTAASCAKRSWRNFSATRRPEHRVLCAPDVRHAARAEPPEQPVAPGDHVSPASSLDPPRRLSITWVRPAPRPRRRSSPGSARSSPPPRPVDCRPGRRR